MTGGIGFNDKGESIPFQGGTNEEVVERLYKILRRDKKEQFLTVYWSVDPPAFNLSR